LRDSENRKDIETFKIIKIHDFTNERKMMSIVVEDDFGSRFVFAKGADSSILKVLDDKNANFD
jgi:magnesium-transporting ATPase (P-type)